MEVKISDVFTPRLHYVNSAMYIDRPYHEDELVKSIEGGRHTVICGESGSGKSWLYRHVAEQQGWAVYPANCANAVRLKSLTEAIASVILKAGSQQMTEYNQLSEAGLGFGKTGASIQAERCYNVRQSEVLLQSFESARNQAKNKRVVVVLDNLEAIFGKPDLMEELANIILLLDDPQYAAFNIKILIVGVPAEVVEYFQSIENLESVANRLQELRPLMSLTNRQIDLFLKRGFKDYLRAQISEIDLRDLRDHIQKVTLGIAQRLHEYCEILAYRMQSNEWRFSKSLIRDCDSKYIGDCLKKSYAVIESFMNGKKTSTGRRNQVLYALGKIDITVFDANRIERIVRAEFPNTTNGVSLAVGQILSELCVNENKSPLLRRMGKVSAYRFADPRYLMCLRLMLNKVPENERVYKLTLRR